MSSNVCSICMKKFSGHTLGEVKECSKKYDDLQFDRLAGKLCRHCGCASDFCDTDGTFICSSCFRFYTEGN